MNGNVVTFETDEFSTYSLVYSDKTAGNSSMNVVNTNNPQTGDNVVLYISVLGLSIIGHAGAGLYIKKKKFN